MSADNGIYILKTNSPKGYWHEYRVKHLQAAENVYWDDNINRESTDPDIMIKNARQMWAGCKVWENESQALSEAQEIEKKIEYTEYGICMIIIDRPFVDPEKEKIKKC